MKKNIVWIVAADSHDAKIFTTSQQAKRAEKPPQLIKEILLETSPNPKPGQGQVLEGFGIRKYGVGPRTNPKDVERQHLASYVARYLRDALSNDKFHKLILISPHKMLSALYNSLDHQVQQLVTHKLYKNITEFSSRELQKYLKERVEIVI